MSGDLSAAEARIAHQKKVAAERRRNFKAKKTTESQSSSYQTVWKPQYREDGRPGPQVALVTCPFDEILFGGARGGGKALPLDERIVTPTGYRAMGEMKVGDDLHGPGGSIVRVIGVYPQGVEDVFRITLVDGRTVRASRGHLWRAHVGHDDMLITTDAIRTLFETNTEISLPVETLDCWVSIEAIEYVGMAETQCIKIDSPDGLFLTNDEIITHNTDGALGCWLEHAARYGEHAKGIFFRRRFKQLEEVQNRCMMLFSKLGALYHKGDAIWVFPNGATLKLRHLWDESSCEEYQGHQYTFHVYEECTNWSTPKAIDKMRATLRSAHGVKTKTILTANPGGAGHCVPFGEVLTPDGWKDIKDFKIGDSVMTVSANGDLVSGIVGQVHRSKYNGPMVNVSARGLSMVCTPNHKVAKAGGGRLSRGAKFSLVPFEKLPGQATILRTVGWEGTPLERIVPAVVETRRRKLDQPTSLSGVQYCSLLGWMLAEGSVIDRDKAFVIAQKKPETREKIRKLLENDCGFLCSWSNQQVHVHAADWWFHFRTLGDCRTKRIPDAVRHASKEELRALFEAMMDGDGHWATRARNSGTYYTISKGLADDVCEVALKLGYLVSLSQRQRENRNGLSYEICFKTVKSGGSEILTGNHLYDVQTKMERASKIDKIDFDGDVYCIGVEGTHNFIIRQNGCIWVSGNSWVKSRFRIGEFPSGYIPIPDPDSGEMRVFIPSRLEDNIALYKNDPNYEKRLLQSGNAALVKAWRWGDWNIVSGGFFDDIFNPDRHILRPFDIPSTWKWRRSFDWGSAAPASLGIWAISDGSPIEEMDGFVFPRGSLIRVSEWYTVARDIAGNIRPNEGLRHTNIALGNGIGQRSMGRTWSGCVADPSIFAKPGRESIYDEMRKGAMEVGHHLNFQPADNSRIAGWQRMRDMLEAAAKDIPEKPGLWSFETCEHYVRTIPVLQRKENELDDIDTDQEDHCLHGDTLVETRSGPIAIKDLVGTEGEVLSIGGEWKRYYDCRMTRRQAECVKVTVADGRSFVATPDHRTFTGNGWIDAASLTGETIVTAFLNPVGSKVVSVEPAGIHDVYNLEVKDTHAFAVSGGLIVHNCADEVRYIAMTGPRTLGIGRLTGT